VSWLITVALEVEAKLIIGYLSITKPVGGRVCFVGQFPGLAVNKVFLVLTGIGQVNAAQSTVAAVEYLGNIEVIVNLGCAGAYPKSGLIIGQVAVANLAIHADLGMYFSDASYYSTLEIIGIPLLRDYTEHQFFNCFPVNKKISKLFCVNKLKEIKYGSFATVSQVSGDISMAQILGIRWGAIIEDMETAAVAQIAAWYGLPFIALRGVSNLVGQRKIDVRLGAEAAQKFLLNVLIG